MALDENEPNDRPIAKFESMLKTDDVYFFDSEDFVDIIHHYLNHGKISLAKKAIKLGLQQHTHCVDLRLLQIEVLVFENEFEHAEFLLDNLQSIDPKHEEIYIQRANIRSKQDQHEAAISLLQQALSLVDDGVDIHSLLGMEYLFMDDFQKAKESFKKCVAIDPYDYSSLYNVVYCYEFLIDHEGAIGYLNEYLENNPYCEVAWHQLGKQYSALDMHPEAITAFDFAIYSDESFIGAYYEKGRVLERQGNFENAIENYKVTIEIEDPTSHVCLSLGRCYEAIGNDTEAQYYYYKTVHEDPLLDKGWMAITKFYLRQEKYLKALEYINKAIAIDEQNPNYWKYCALIHKALHQFHEADFAFKQAVDFGDLEEDTWMQWAETLLLLGDRESTDQIVHQGMSFFKESPKFLHHAATLYVSVADSDRAQVYLQTAWKNWPEQTCDFAREYTELYNLDWTKELLAQTKDASN